MLPILTAFAGTTAFAPLPFAPPPSTLTETSETHTAPQSLHAFTCTVCHPLGALTGPFIDWPAKTGVDVLLSSEYPTYLTGREEQESALMVRLKGDPTTAPFDGLEICVPAIAERSAARNMKEARERLLIVFIQYLRRSRSCVVLWPRRFPFAGRMHTHSCQCAVVKRSTRRSFPPPHLRPVARGKCSPDSSLAGRDCTEERSVQASAQSPRRSPFNIERNARMRFSFWGGLSKRQSCDRQSYGSANLCAWWVPVRRERSLRLQARYALYKFPCLSRSSIQTCVY